jgi:hypothetical protein
LSASASAEGFDYSYFSLGYGNVDLDGFSDNGDGFALGASLAFTSDLHVFAGYEDAELSSAADVSRWRVGLGYNTTLTETIDMFGRLSYESLDVDVPVVGNDDDGFGLSVGARIRAGINMELTAAINYVNYDRRGDDTGLEVGVLYNFSNTWTAGLLGEWSDNVNTYTITGRYYFGK